MVGGLLTSAFLTLEIIPVIVTYWRYEQLLWQRLSALGSTLLGRLRLDAWILAGGAAAAVALAVAKLYVTFPGSTFLIAQILAGAVFLGGTAAYLIHRPAAKRTVWPAASQFNP
jgi:hypothetical protein